MCQSVSRTYNQGCTISGSQVAMVPNIFTIALRILFILHRYVCMIR
jgi:hypothetical protein